MRTPDTSSPAKELLKKELNALDAITATSPPGTLVIVGLRTKDGLFLRGLVIDNQKERLKIRWRFRKRQNIPSWHPDSKRPERVKNIRKKNIKWLHCKHRTPKRSIVNIAPAIVPVEKLPLVAAAA